MIKIVLFVVGIIVVWLIITQPDTSAPVIGAIIKNLGAFAQDVLTAFIKFISNVSTLISKEVK